jgi:hypothetical protein
MAKQKEKQKRPAPSQGVPRNFFPSHPHVGAIADQIGGFGMSAATQIRASYQAPFEGVQDRLSIMVSEHKHLGPEPTRAVVPYGRDSDKRLRTFLRPEGFPVRYGNR